MWCYFKKTLLNSNKHNEMQLSKIFHSRCFISCIVFTRQVNSENKKSGAMSWWKFVWILLQGKHVAECNDSRKVQSVPEEREMYFWKKFRFKFFNIVHCLVGNWRKASWSTSPECLITVYGNYASFWLHLGFLWWRDVQLREADVLFLKRRNMCGFRMCWCTLYSI